MSDYIYPQTNKVDMMAAGQQGMSAQEIQDIKSSITGGLTKREYFAGLAMQGLCADPTLVGKYEPNLKEMMANGAVNLADALIAELDKTEVRDD